MISNEPSKQGKEDRDERDRGQRPDRRTSGHQAGIAGASRPRRSAVFDRRDRAATGGHQQPDLLALGGRPVDERHDLAAVHHGDPIGQLEDLVELGRDEEDRRSLISLGDHLAMDELDAADIEAARRLVENEGRELPAELPSDDRLLLVAARQRRRRERSSMASGCRTRRSLASPSPRSPRRFGTGRGHRAPRRTG